MRTNEELPLLGVAGVVLVAAVVVIVHPWAERPSPTRARSSDASRASASEPAPEVGEPSPEGSGGASTDAHATSGAPPSGPVPLRAVTFREAPLWTVTDTNPTAFPFPEADVGPGTPIRLDLAVLERAAPGDRLVLRLPGQGEVAVEIERVTDHGDGTSTLSGVLTDASERYPVVVTTGRSMSFGNVVTPAGTYVLEARGASGWIYVDTLDERIDPTQPDTLAPGAL